jgi:hypothetical protein
VSAECDQDRRQYGRPVNVQSDKVPRRVHIWTGNPVTTIAGGIWQLVFSTVAAPSPYLRDIFGSYQVGAIHGRLLTAWSVAGVLGPRLVTYFRDYQLDNGVPKAQAYSVTMYVMCGMLLIGFICNFAMRAVDPKFHLKVAGAAGDKP